MAIINTEAIVLKRYDLRETSLLVNFYTLENGKITGEMKGIREDPGKFASSVELFSCNDIIFYQKRNSSVHLVSQCDLKENFQPIRQNVHKITAASAIIELIDSVMAQEDKNCEIFALAKEALSELAVAEFADKILTIFKIKLLSLSGFKPHLDCCVSCQGNASSGQTRFSLRLGGLLCQKCGANDSNSRTIFRGTIATILHIEKNSFREDLKLGMNPQIKRELEMVLNSFLNYHLGKDLKSDRTMQKLKDSENGL